MTSKQNTELGMDITGLTNDVAGKMVSRASHFSRTSRMSRMEKLNLTEYEDEQVQNEEEKPKAITQIIDIDYPPIIATGHDDSTIRLWNETVYYKIIVFIFYNL